MLGIIIGVAAVIIIISLGDGMNDMINSEFEKMGTNLLQVQIMAGAPHRTLTKRRYTPWRTRTRTALPP